MVISSGFLFLLFVQVLFATDDFFGPAENLIKVCTAPGVLGGGRLA